MPVTRGVSKDTLAGRARHDERLAGQLAEPERSVPGLEVEHVSKSFRAPDGSAFAALKDVSVDIRPGHFVCFVGPSGCGKSTLLNLIAGLLQPDRGSIRVAGHPIVGVSANIGYITQGDTLLPWASVERNVGIALEVRGTRKAERRERTHEILRRVGLDGFANHYPSQLSGGMRKRAILARTLLQDPDILLMDEPFGALDALLRSRMQDELLELWERDRKTVVFVTHDIDEAIRLADDVVVFRSNPGRIVHIEHVDIPRPRTATSHLDSRFQELWVRLWSLIQHDDLEPDSSTVGAL